MSAAAAPPVSARHMIAVLGSVACIAGVLVVTAYELALPRIQQNRAIALERAIARVYPGAAAHRAFLVTEQGLVHSDDPAPSGQVVYSVFDANGRFLGIAAEAAARGYQDVVRLLYAYSPACQCITGIHVLRNNDTPGIGDKIAKDAQFLENFRALDARLDDRQQALRHAIVTVKHGSKTEAWQIDAISGATITSKAVGRALNDSAQALLPRVAARLGELSAPQPRP
jgi:electron transport complex protein RnfG